MNKLSQVAAMVRKAGATGSRDTILAHITPDEAAMLKARGGSGRIDPETGLPHFEDDSDSSSPSENGAGYQTQYSNLAPMHSDPNYSSKGYYSAGGNADEGDSQGSGSTRYYAYRRTVGGDIANSFGADPEGGWAKLGNGAVSALGYINPMAGLVGKIMRAGVGSNSIASPADMDGNGGSLNMLGRVITGNDPKYAALSSIPMFQAGQAGEQPAQSQQQTQMARSGGGSNPSSISSVYGDLLRKRRASMA